MRTLRFIVDKQIITQDPNCDFSGLVPGSSGYLQAEFSFSSEWNDCLKVAGFYSMLGEEYTPQFIKNNCCIIPAEALQKRQFKIMVGGKKDDLQLTTNTITVTQDGGKT